MDRCVRLHVLRGVRQARPVVRRTGRFVHRHVVKTTVASFVPSLLNDTVVHHQALTPAELLHVATDDISVSTVVALTNVLLKLL
jgi:hypothetical protein